MTTTKLKNQATWYDPLNTPVIMTSIAIVYAIFVTLALFAVPKSSPIYNLVAMVTFPAFVLTPMIFLYLPIKTRYRAILVAIALLIVMPIVGFYFQEYLDTVIQICIYACLALGLNVVVGYAGLLDLGYIAFFAVGAYLWGMFTSTAPTIFQEMQWVTTSPYAIFPFIILGALLAGLVGIILGLPVLRLKGDYLAIVTLGFGEIIRVVARNLDRPTNWTNGALGLNNVLKPPSDFLIPPVTNLIAFLDMSVRDIRVDKVETIASNLMIYLISLAILLVVVYVSRALDDSPIGRAWTAIREDEVAAVAMGVPKLGMKIRAFALGATFGGAVGVLFSAKQTFIDPASFLLIASISILSMVIIGGLGSVKGVLLGAIIVKLIELHILTNLNLQISSMKSDGTILFGFNMSTLDPQLDPTKFKPLIFGAILVTMMVFRPAGLLPAKRRQLELEDAHEPNITVAA